MSKTKKSWLVDVPVVVDAFIRPQKLKQVFEAIRIARPKILFIVSDGPRENHPEDMKKIMESRAIFENVDWDCQVHKIYYKKIKVCMVEIIESTFSQKLIVTSDSKKT